MTQKVSLRGIQAEFLGSTKGRERGFLIFRVRPCVQNLIWRKISESKVSVGVMRDGDNIILKKTKTLKKALRVKKLINLELVVFTPSMFRKGKAYITMRPMAN